MTASQLTPHLADRLATLLALEGYAAMWWVTEQGGIHLATNASSQIAESLAALVGATS